MEINYIYQYDLAASIMMLVLIILFFTQRNFMSRTGKYYLGLIICAFLAAVTDLISVVNLNYMTNPPTWLNYLVNIVYLITYNMVAVFYFCYVIMVTMKGKNSKKYMMVANAVAIIDVLLIALTPWTHSVIYFDEQGRYCHGLLFYLLYVNVFIIFYFILRLFFRYRTHLTKRQSFIIVAFNVTTLIMVIIQGLFPDQLIVNFSNALFSILLYLTLQNPDDYIDNQVHCYNLRAFMEGTGELMARNKSFDVVGIQIDDFVYMNQTIGAEPVRIFLMQTAEFLTTQFGDQNVFHLAGGRFAILSSAKLKNSGEEIAKVITEYFSKPVEVNESHVLLRMYACVIHYPDFAASPQDLYEALMGTLKEIEQKQSRELVYASKEYLDRLYRQRQISHILKRAIRNQEFEVFFQPIYHGESQRFHSMEALVRLRDKELGFISPEEFIPLAERNGSIHDIGKIVLEQVCSFLKEHDYRSAGIQYVEVNLSTIQCMKDSLAGDLLDIMNRYEVDPSIVNFEITETAGLGSQEVLDDNMNRIMDYGSGFSLDDYGTGFSNMDYLMHMPCKIVKIDKSLLWAAVKDESAYKVLEHVVDLLKSLNKKIVVEGVETQDMADMLFEMGCDNLQGYFYSKPIPQEEFWKFVQEKNVS